MTHCPWCRIEDEGGPSFFAEAGLTSIVSPERLDHLAKKIAAIRVKAFPELAIRRLELPGLRFVKKLEQMPKIQLPDVATLILVILSVVALLAIWHSGALVVSILGCVLAGSYLIFNPRSKDRRNTADKFMARLAEGQTKLLQIASRIASEHQQREREFKTSVKDLKTEIECYHAEGEELKQLLEQHSGSQKRDFLRKHLIRDSFGDIRGLKRTMVPMLESYGVDSALDINKLNLYGVPNIDPSLVMELMGWREKVEQQYEFNPSHGVTVQEMNQSEEVTTNRFKLSQSRIVLMAASRLNALADGGKSELDRSLSYFDSLTDHWKNEAKKLRDFQSSRYHFERTINRSVGRILGIALGGPVLGTVLYFLFNS